MSTDSTELNKMDRDDSSREVSNYVPMARDNMKDDFIGADDISRTYSQRNLVDEENCDISNGMNDDAPAGAAAANANGKEPQGERLGLARSGTGKGAPSTHGFFSRKVSTERKSLVIAFLKNWAIIAFCILLVFSIYWGALYNRSSRLHNLRMLMVVEDQEVDGVEPLVGNFIQQLPETAAVKASSRWTIFNSSSEFQKKHYSVQNKTTGEFNVTQEINRLIHHQKYWVALYVKPNTTYSLYQALKNASSSYDPNKNQQLSIDAIYETSRDLLNMNSTILPAFDVLSKSFSPSALASKVMAPLIQKLSSDEKSNLIDTAPGVIVNVPQIQLKDLNPVTNSTITAPTQVGMIFLIIITFFQFNFFAPVHQIIARRIHKGHFALYRMVSAQISYFILSLPYCLVSLAFQVDFDKAFGHSGFLVYWMTCYLTMAAVGGANENMALLIIPFYPPVLGFWLLFWVISNISPTFFPIAVLPRVYRYGYAFPLHNALEIFKVIFTDCYKGQMGRNYGILLAWIVINNLIFPFALKRFGKTMAKKAAAGKK